MFKIGLWIHIDFFYALDRIQKRYKQSQIYSDLGNPSPLATRLMMSTSTLNPYDLARYSTK